MRGGGVSPRSRTSTTSPSSNAAAPKASPGSGTANNGSPFTRISCHPPGAIPARILAMGASPPPAQGGGRRVGRTTQHRRPVCVMSESFASSYSTQPIGGAAPGRAMARMRSRSPPPSCQTVSGSGAPLPPSRCSTASAWRAVITPSAVRSNGVSVGLASRGAKTPHSSSRHSAAPSSSPQASAQKFWRLRNASGYTPSGAFSAASS